MRGNARFVAAIAAVTIVWLAFFFLFIRPRQAELKQTLSATGSEENMTVQLRAELSQLQELQRNAPGLDAELTEIRRLVPPDNEVANFVFLAEDAANRAGIGVVQITPELPKPPPEGAPLGEVRATIGATGTYFAVQDFFRRLYELERAVRIDLVSLTAAAEGETATTTSTSTAAGGPPEIDVTMTARIFFEAPEGASVAAAGATTSPAPAPTPAPAAP